ncbi:MAG TPA: RelA/SpoT family protein, partial [bacterium]|nr:RelA/SpoT family protein [bacterium]
MKVSETPETRSKDTEVAASASISIDRVLGELSVNYPQADLNLIQQAFDLSRKAHEGQFRESGEPYVVHPVAVAQILAELRMDCVTIAAALLHDVVEDAGIEDRQLRHEFGDEIAFLVEGVTKVSRLVSDSSYEDEQLESFRRLLVATAKDQRTVLIKLADRLHNMRTLQYLSSDKRKLACQSTLDIYAPLAHRMGIGRVKDELEDLALKFLHPDIYRDLKEKVAQKAPERQIIIEQASEVLRKTLQSEDLRFEISKRVKHYYSIYRKMVTTHRSFDEIYDLLALRILTEKDSDCYLILGKVHQLWKPLDGRFKDFISVPKVNGYRSLHTTVVGPRSRLMEIQIRTHDMHNVAENGIAAHWRYKRDQGTTTRVGDDTRWLGQFSQDLLETVSPEEFMDSLKVDLFAEEIVVYTPNSDLIQLPRGSTIVDFAYKIHSEVGDHCRAGKVNGKFVPLSYVIQTGDRVEVITKKEARPSRDWLSFAKTARARNKIRKFLMQVERGELLETGKALLTRELERLRVP